MAGHSLHRSISHWSAKAQVPAPSSLHAPSPTLPVAAVNHRRPKAGGKFLFVGEEKRYLCGVTYGPFAPTDGGSMYHTLPVVRHDFARMRAHGINTVRTYTVPPRWLLDEALRQELYVLVGLPWEQHVAFLDEPERMHAIETRVRADVQACTGHPAVLGYAVGNEIPASIVRWYGPQRIARFIERLYRAAKDEDPGALVTYVNYPTTEYLQVDLPFLDFVCFNVYLEDQASYEAYLSRLQNLAGDRPLVMGEIGLDSRRNGTRVQARTLDWQLRTALAAGCAGTFVFSWTDEWYRGGHEIDDWDFGLTDRLRRPKPALDAVADAFAEVPVSPRVPWPRISVIVCSHNGAATIRDTLEALRRVDYPDFEVIVVVDGATDATAAITRDYDVRLIETENRGLSAARNTGLEAATGEIVAYLDDDAYPDPHWLTYLAVTFTATDHVAVGGPNIAPPNDGFVAEAVNHAPGNPIHVLFSDCEAEHLPGCNVAFRTEALQAIGGFDTQFRIAGDDVDVCWRLQARGWTLGFHPAAMVWHHRRATVRAFWAQQLNYGKAEALLEMKWPEKYNRIGHLRWHGRVYNGDLAYFSAFRRWRVYYGQWGGSPFQSLRTPEPGLSETLPLVPEWYLLIAALAVIAAAGAFWSPLLWALVPLTLAAGVPLVQAGRSAARATRRHGGRAGTRLQLLTTFLHLMQPLARLVGRLQRGLTPWRQFGRAPFALPRPRSAVHWSETWRPPATWLGILDRTLREQHTLVQHGGDFDRWDLEVRGGLFGSARLLMGIEEHGDGRQMLRLRTWPRLSLLTGILTTLLGTLAATAAVYDAGAAALLLGVVAALCLLRSLRDAAAAQGALHEAIDHF